MASAWRLQGGERAKQDGRAEAGLERAQPDKGSKAQRQGSEAAGPQNAPSPAAFVVHDHAQRASVVHLLQRHLLG